MRNMADGEEWNVPPTIDDRGVLDEIAAKLEDLGYPVSA
jgi:hypothetical protein